MKYDIEKGIPVTNYSAYPFHSMEVGDSFFINEANKSKRKQKQRKAVSSAYMYALRNKIEFKIKTATNNEGIRIWRVL